MIELCLDSCLGAVFTRVEILRLWPLQIYLCDEICNICHFCTLVSVGYPKRTKGFRMCKVCERTKSRLFSQELE